MDKLRAPLAASASLRIFTHMRKNRSRFIFVSFALVFAALLPLQAGGIPNVDTTVSDASGKLVYRGKTDANGVFASGQVPAGDYVVQFKAKNAAPNRNDYAIYAAAGHQKVVADAVAGTKLAGAGVAIRLKSTTKTPIIGQVAVGGVNALGTKIVNGKRYVLVAQTGDVAPRWVEEGSDTGRNITRIHIEDPAFIKSYNMNAAH